jgi:hypothetical protein
VCIEKKKIIPTPGNKTPAVRLLTASPQLLEIRFNNPIAFRCFSAFTDFEAPVSVTFYPRHNCS